MSSFLPNPSREETGLAQIAVEAILCDRKPLKRGKKVGQAFSSLTNY